MIWKTPDGPAEVSEALVRHLAFDIAAALGDLETSPANALDIARGVAAYCADLALDSVLPTGYLALLASRALWGVGEKEAARRFADGGVSSGVRPEVFESAMRFSHLPPAVWKVFASGLVRPSRWLADRDGVVWVLDLSRVKASAEDGMELALLQGLRALLGTVAPIWDEARGRGSLGLRGSSEQVRSFCRDLLKRLARQREWASVPAVLDLDVRGRRRARAARR